MDNEEKLAYYIIDQLVKKCKLDGKVESHYYDVALFKLRFEITILHIRLCA